MNDFSNDFSNADALVSAVRCVLVLTGEHEAAEALRGVEVFNRRDAAAALGALKGLQLHTEDGRTACEAAEAVLRQVLEATELPRVRPVAA